MISTSLTIQFLQSPPQTHFKPTTHNHLAPPSSLKFQTPSATVAAHASAQRTTSSTFAPPKLASPPSFYEVLGISMGASSQEIKTAYRRLARVCHPDVVGNDQKDTCTDQFLKVHSAYSTLSDPEKRADYDRRIFMRRGNNMTSLSFVSFSSSGGVSDFTRFKGYGSRNWETDQCW